MVRNYKKKTEPKYSLEKLSLALESVRNGDSVYSVSKRFEIPLSTLWNRIKRGTDSTIQGPGRKQLVPKEIEEDLAANLKYLCELQQPLTRAEIVSIVQEYFEVKKIPNPFSKINKAPGREWMDGFLSRYPDLVRRKAQPLQKARVQSSTKEAFIKFFNLLKNKITSLGIKDPSQIVNLDETGYSSSVGAHVIASKGSRCVSQVQGGSGKETYSVVETIAANGDLFPPLIIYKSKNIYNTWCTNGPKDAAYLSSENGWQDKKTFFFYFQKFVEWSKDRPKPILVIYDGHVSHIQYRVSELAIANDIHIITLPAHSSDKIQPLDVGVFGPVKKEWLKIKREHGRKTSFKTITKEEFPRLMRELRVAFKEENIRAGFKSSGIWPLDLKKALSKLPPDATLQTTPTAVVGVAAVTPAPETMAQLLQIAAVEPAPEFMIMQVSDTAAETPAPESMTAQLPDTVPMVLATKTSEATALPPPETSRFPLGQLLAPNETLSAASTPSAGEPALGLFQTTTLNIDEGEHDLLSFRKVLLKAISPGENRGKTKKKKISFNNAALTEEDVMKQMLEEEKAREDKENKKQIRQISKNIKKEKAETKARGLNGHPVKGQKRKKVALSLKKLFQKNKRSKRLLDDFESSSSDDEIFDSLSDSSDDIFFNRPISDEEEPSLCNLDQPGTSGLGKRIEKFQKDNYVAACYDKQWFIAQVLESTDIDSNGVAIYCSLKFTQIKGENKFIWPARDDIIQVPSEDILCVVSPPIPVSSRHIGLETEDHKKVRKLFQRYLIQVDA